jgi:hypothetical protein
MEKVFFEKDNIRISKTPEEEYHMQCIIENHQLLLEKIINFDLLKLIYDLNVDVYEKTELHKISDSEANILFIMKNLFPDLGMPQRFAYLKVRRSIDRDLFTQKTKKIVFQSEFILDEKGQMVKPEHLPKDVFPLPIESLVTECLFLSENKIHISNKIKINSGKLNIPAFVEKLLSKIIYKVFSRVKQFIENCTV